MARRSSLRIDAIKRVASGSTASGAVSPDAASGHTAPSSIQCWMISTLLVAERPRRRHLRAERRADQAVIQTAAACIAGTDVRLTSAAHGVRAPIEPQAAVLLRGTVTADAVLAENRLNVALEIDAGRRLGGRRQSHCRRSEREHSDYHGA